MQGSRLDQFLSHNDGRSGPEHELEGAESDGSLGCSADAAAAEEQPAHEHRQGDEACEVEESIAGLEADRNQWMRDYDNVSLMISCRCSVHSFVTYTWEGISVSSQGRVPI